VTDLIDPDRVFALNHVPPEDRGAVGALWALDEQLGQIVASTSQPMTGQMRLLWWREALEKRLSGHPVLAEMALAFDRGVDADALGVIIDGWEELLEPLPLDEAQLAAFAEARGGQLFALTARICGVTSTPDAGAGWALVDFGVRCSDAVTSVRALAMANRILPDVNVKALPRPLRILVRLARRDVEEGKRGTRTPWKLLRSVA
jgi:15-cis-phytoene synthase